MVEAAIDQLTFEQYLAYDNGTDRRYELVDGKLLQINPPSIKHFLIAKYLEQAFDDAIQRSQQPWMTFRETGIRTGYRKSRLTDLCIVTRDQAKELLGQPAVFQTPPLLIVEVVSPDSIKRDYRYQRSEYAALEVPEYWIVDPLAEKVVLLQLEEGLYEEQEFRADQSLVSPTLPNLLLTVEQILAAGTIA